MSLDFSGRVVAVTGAGRGIGRAYALLLGRLGAQVVVNDLGGSAKGTGGDPGPANEVVEEIRAAGGTAAADASDVATPEGGAAVVATALQAFGRIDGLVNNAGNMIWAQLPELDVATLDAVLDVHVRGSFNTIRAAWPHMVEQGYGRIVLTSSIGMLGMPDNLPYATAKAAMLGMANSLTALAGKRDIRINTIAPNAITRLAGKPEEGGENRGFGEVPAMDPAAVAPMAAYLAHEACQVSGEVYAAGAGRFARLFLAQTPGWVADDAAGTASDLSLDDVAAHWEEINAEDGYYVPRDPVHWSRRYMAHLFPGR